MKLFKRVFIFYLQSSIHVAIAIVALTLLTAVYLNLQLDFYVLGFVFTAAICGYNFVRYSFFSKQAQKGYVYNLKGIQVISLGCFIGMLYFLLQFAFLVQLLAFVSGVLTLLYVVPLQRKWKNYRSIPGLKLFYIAFVLVLISVLIPVLYVDYQLNSVFWILCLLRFGWVVVLMLPFEIRDLKTDSLVLKTLPQKIGVAKTKVLGVLLLVFLAITESYFGVFFENTFGVVWVIVLIMGFVLWYSSENRPFYFTAFWVEAIPVLWLVLEVGFKQC